MKTKVLASLMVIACSAIASAETKDTPLQIYPKNQARHHIGANLFIYDGATNTYTPTEASAAWLDDDVTTAWPMEAGKQYYLVALPQAELLTNFTLSAQPVSGKITLYASDEPTPPGDKKWSVVARNVSLNDVNERKFARPFSRLARYLLIETNLADPVPVYSLYLYNDKPAANYHLIKREQPVDVSSATGANAHNRTSFNLAGLYADSVVFHANSTDGFVGWQRSIDDDPETGLFIAPSAERAGATIKYPEKRAVTRIAVLTDPAAKGKLDFYLSERIPSEQGATEAALIGPEAPTATFVFDGTTARSAIDIPRIETGSMLIRWTPDNETDSIGIREINAFGDLDLRHYAVSTKPEPIGEKTRDRSKGGKDFKQPEPIAEGPEPIADLLPQTGPYLPGALGFPPNVGVISTRVPPREIFPPEEPVSQ